MHGRFTSFKDAVAGRGRPARRGSGRPARSRSSSRRSSSLSPERLLVFLAVRRLAPRVPALLGRRCSSGSAPASIANAALCLGTLVFNRRAWRRRTTARPGGGRALGGVPPLPLRLPAPAGGAARDARALGALPRLRHRVRDRRARAPGRAAPHARGARTRRARSTGSHRSGDLGSGASSLSIGDLASGFGDALAPPELGIGRRRRRLLRRRWRRRRWRRRRVRLSPLPQIGIRRSRSDSRSRESSDARWRVVPLRSRPSRPRPKEPSGADARGRGTLNRTNSDDADRREALRADERTSTADAVDAAAATPGGSPVRGCPIRTSGPTTEQDHPSPERTCGCVHQGKYALPRRLADGARRHPRQPWRELVRRQLDDTRLEVHARPVSRRHAWREAASVRRDV